MNSEEIKGYLADLFDIELNLYIQEKTIQSMKIAYNLLQVKDNLHKPIYRTAPNKSAFPVFIITALVAAISASVGIILNGGGVLDFILAFITYGFIIGALCGIVIAVPIEKAQRKRLQKKLDKEYEALCEQYEDELQKNREKVENSERKKKCLEWEIKRMTGMLSRSYESRRMLYEQNLLYKDYRNLIAVGTLYGYFVKGQARSLSPDLKTGDQGAYSIYKNQFRLGKIITSTEKILKKQEAVFEAQQELAESLLQAEERVNTLCNGVNSFIHSVNSRLDKIAECAEITAYNSERAARELEYFNWLKIL